MCKSHTEVDPRIEATIGAEKVHSRLSIVAFASLVDLRLCQHNEAGPVVIPFQLYFVALKEVLLRGRTIELGNVVHTD